MRVKELLQRNFLPISQILFNDEKEHSFQIQCHFQSLQENETIPNDVDDDVLASFKKICSSLVDESSKQWDIIRESYEKHAIRGTVYCLLECEDFSLVNILSFSLGYNCKIMPPVAVDDDSMTVSSSSGCSYTLSDPNNPDPNGIRDFENHVIQSINDSLDAASDELEYGADFSLRIVEAASTMENCSQIRNWHRGSDCRID